MLVHLLVFYSIGLLLQFHMPKPQEAKVEILEVSLAQPDPVNSQTESSKVLLTSKSPAQFKVSQSTVKTTPEHIPKPNAPIDQATATTGEVEGVAFPSAVPTPSQGGRRSNSSLFQARPLQQDAARTYYQQAMETQARQQSEQQAQIIILQLQQVLVKQLDVQPLVTGSCKLVESEGGVNSRLKCDSSALYEVISGEKQNITAMLNALRGLGQTYTGFSAEINADKPSVRLLNNPQ